MYRGHNLSVKRKLNGAVVSHVDTENLARARAELAQSVTEVSVVG